jgi:hypothetical protein
MRRYVSVNRQEKNLNIENNKQTTKETKKMFSTNAQ